ncbi:MAG: glycosyltransferase family 4 protein [Rhodospirillales bacterium]|nr:glycosyltransferase family 4 protein [Rhodospirillales bacterium]
MSIRFSNVTPGEKISVSRWSIEASGPGMNDGRPMNIALPTSTFLPNVGGVEVGLSVIAGQLTLRGHKPVIIAPYRLVRALRQMDWIAEYPVVSFPPKIFQLLRRCPRVGFAALDLFYARIARQYGIDVWHGTVGYPTGVSLAHYAYGNPKAAPVLVRCAGEDIQRDPEINYGMRLDPRVDGVVRQWLPRADKLVAITESVAQEYRDIGIPDKQIAFIPNGVTLDRFSSPFNPSAVRQGLGISPDTFLFLSVGRNHPKKNFPILLDVADALRAKTSQDFQIWIVGNGGEPVEHAARERGLDQVVRILPAFTQSADTPFEMPPGDLIDLYRAADAFVFPSKVETFGIVLVEAMAAGLPVITTDSPGCRDVVRRDTDGVTVSHDDVVGFADAMQRIMADTNHRAMLSARAKERAKDFSWDAIVDAYLQTYAEIIDARRSSRMRLG